MKAFWILWNPDYDRPPRVRFSTKAEALDVAQQMAVNLKVTLYVLKATDEVKLQTPPVEVTRLK